jgi:hypothetical protein
MIFKIERIESITNDEDPVIMHITDQKKSVIHEDVMHKDIEKKMGKDKKAYFHGLIVDGEIILERRAKKQEW